MSTRDDFIEGVYLKWRLPLLKILSRKIKDTDHAEDIAQESFTRWLTSRTKEAPDNPQAYVTRIALNAVHEWRGKREQEHHIVSSIDDDATNHQISAPTENTCPQRHAENRQMLARIEQALQELPQRQCEALTLHRFDGLSYEEIAATMQISRALVSRLISQAVAYCRLRANYPSQQAMQSALALKEGSHDA